MKTILLVDDEFPARQLVKAMLPWEETGFAIAYEAKNGAEAFALYQTHRPDLVISDIQMPVMDGLELLTAIRQIDAQQPFIILSCYERFDYARQVIRLGGLDYLIKDTLTPDVLYTALQRVRHHQRPEPAPEGAAPPGPKAGGFLLSAPLEQWLETGNSEALLQALQPEAEHWQYLFASVRAENAPRLKGEDWPLACLPFSVKKLGVCSLPSGEVLLLALFDKQMEAGQLRRSRHELLHALKCMLENAGKGTVTMGVSAVHSSFLELPKARKESEDALRYRLFLGLGNILYFSPLHNASHATQQRHLEARIANLRSALSSNSFPTVAEELEKLYRSDLSGVMQLHYLDQLNTILWGIFTEEQLLRGHTGEDTPALHKLEEIQNSTVEEMKASFLALFRAQVEQGERPEAGPYSQRIRQIIGYIQENLQEDMGLESLAAHFQTHKAHLARTFKEETGMGVHEFIRRRRVEKAQELLLYSQYRVNEIVYQVGFKNPQNFYTLFTRYVGLTPRAYREKFG